MQNACKLISEKLKKEIKYEVDINLVCFSKGSLVVNHILAEYASINKYNLEKIEKIIDCDDK